jgi:hypothetical protein
LFIDKSSITIVLSKFSACFGSLNHFKAVLIGLSKCHIFYSLGIFRCGLANFLAVKHLFLPLWTNTKETIGMNDFRNIPFVNTALYFFGFCVGKVGAGAFKLI